MKCIIFFENKDEKSLKNLGPCIIKIMKWITIFKIKTKIKEIIK